MRGFTIRQEALRICFVAVRIGEELVKWGKEQFTMTIVDAGALRNAPASRTAVARPSNAEVTGWRPAAPC